MQLNLDLILSKLRGDVTEQLDESTYRTSVVENDTNTETIESAAQILCVGYRELLDELNAHIDQRAELDRHEKDIEGASIQRSSLD